MHAVGSQSVSHDSIGIIHVLCMWVEEEETTHIALALFARAWSSWPLRGRAQGGGSTMGAMSAISSNLYPMCCEGCVTPLLPPPPHTHSPLVSLRFALDHNDKRHTSESVVLHSSSTGRTG